MTRVNLKAYGGEKVVCFQFGWLDCAVCCFCAGLDAGKFLLPGFALLTFGQALIAAVIIAVLGFIVESIFGKRVSPQNRGIVGFITAAVVIYITQFLVPGMTVSILGALLAAIIIGVIDLFVPTHHRRGCAGPNLHGLAIEEGGAFSLLVLPWRRKAWTCMGRPKGYPRAAAVTGSGNLLQGTEEVAPAAAPIPWLL